MLIHFVIVPILVAVFLYLFPLERAARIIACFVQAGILALAFYLFYATRETDLSVVLGPNEGFMAIMLRADAISSVFILLTAFIFLIVTLYSVSDDNSRMFWMLLFIWEGILLGIFLTGDLFNIFVLTEVSTITVSVLIMYYRDKRSMYDGLIYLMINLVVVQFYLLGLGYFYRVVGFMDMQAAGYAIANIDSRQLILPYAFMMTFVALKCALLPLYSWLPKAHSTPGATPVVSAVLSGLHIKGGVYLFLRFQELFGGTEDGIYTGSFFLILGLATAVFGIIMALVQRDIKRILAYSTIAQIGLIIAGLNIGGEYNRIGSLFHSVNHAVIKSALFLSAGMISHHYNTRDIEKIRGVFKTMPVVAVVSVLAILGMVGSPGFNASISKYFLMHGVSGPLNIILILINLGTIMVFIRYARMLFGPDSGSLKIKKARSDLWKEAPLAVLGLMCFMLGVFGPYFISYLFGWAARVDFAGYLEKSAIFVASTVAGFFILKYAIKGQAASTRIREFDLGFRGMCAAMGVFFGLVLVVAGLAG